MGGGVEANPNPLCLCAAKRGSNRGETVNMRKGKPALNVNKVMTFGLCNHSVTGLNNNKQINNKGRLTVTQNIVKKID